MNSILQEIFMEASRYYVVTMRVMFGEVREGSNQPFYKVVTKSGEDSTVKRPQILTRFEQVA